MSRRSAAGFERHLIEGRLHFRRGSFAPATRELALARSRDPTRPEVHRLLGLCYARLGRTGEASEALRQALCLDPLDFVARGALAILLSQNGDPAPAIEELEDGMTLLQERAAATSQEAKAAVECGRLPEALAMLRRAACRGRFVALPVLYLRRAWSRKRPDRLASIFTQPKELTLRWTLSGDFEP